LRGTTAAPEQIPYQALAEALRAAAPLVGKLDIPAIWLAALGVLLPEIVTARAGVPVLPALDPEREQARLFEALATTLCALAKARPLLLVLDDLHWAGLSSLRALEFLARRAAGQSWLIVATYRSDEVAPGDPFATLRRRLANENLVGSMVLGGLAPAELSALVAALPPLAAQSDALGRRIAAISDGNPLFACELVRDFIERGDVAARSAKLETTISARLGRLGERARTVAEIASVAGATFDVESVAQVAGWSEHELFEAMGELLDRRIVREIGRSSFTFAFSHHLIAAALYAEIPAERRARWHLRLASVLERSGERGTSARLAHHLASGGEPARAAAAYLAAGHDAFAIYANAEACDLAARGLALHEDLDALRFELVALRERVFERLGDAAGRGDDLAELERIAGALGDGTRDDAVLQRRIDYEHDRGERGAELRAIEELYRRAAERDDERVLAAAFEGEALYRRSTAEFEDACRLAGEALERYTRLDDDAGRVRALTIGALSAAALGRTQAQTLIDHATRIAEGTDDTQLRARLLLSGATVALFRQDYRRFAESAEKTLELCRSSGDREGEAVCHHQVGTAYWTAWRVSESLEHLRTAVHLCEELRSREGVTRSLCNLGSLMQDCGLYDGAREIHERALALAIELGAADLAVVCELNLGLIREALGDISGAMDCAERAYTEATRLGIKRYVATSLAQRGTLRRRLGAIREAIDDLERAVSLARESGRPADAAEWLGYAALAHLHGGQTLHARAAIERGRAATEGGTIAAFMMYPTLFYWAAAQVYRASGDAAACAQALSRAKKELRSRAAGLPDDRWRQAYAAIRAHREIVAAAERDEWPAFSPSS
jgi:tetratricopeptide (TPR) repeat protein